MAGVKCKVVAVEHLSLDGVFQAPGRQDEDLRNGFAHGGWASANDSPETQELIGKHMEKGWSLLVGRSTYEALHEGWRVRQPGSAMEKSLTSVEKFVVSRNAGYTPVWENSTLLVGEAAEIVAKLKSEHEKTLVIFGSGQVLRALLERRLVDELTLIIHPLLLGQGFRLFDPHIPYADLQVTEKLVTESGVMAATYRVM